MAGTVEAALESVSEHGNGVRVEFEKQGDRFGHTIYTIAAGQVRAVLSSVEGTQDEPAPPSPPFVEVHQQEQTLYLTGATTLGHWSMSIEVTECGFWFDVACRVKAEHQWLGSTYQLFDKQVSVETRAETHAEFKNNALLISPLLNNSIVFPMTVQWSYEIKMNKASDVQ